MGSGGGISGTEYLSNSPDSPLWRIRYLLLFLPIVAFYPFYPIQGWIGDREESADQMQDTVLLATLGKGHPTSIAISLVALIGLVTIVSVLTHPIILTKGTLPPFTVERLILGEFGMTFSGLILGVGVTLFISNRQLQRELGRRVVVALLVAVVLGVAYLIAHNSNLVFQADTIADFRPGLLPVISTIYGAMVANSYVLKQQGFQRFNRRESAVQHPRDFTNQKTYHGEELDPSEGERILEQFAQEKQTVADDLIEQSSIKRVVRIEPLKKITRELKVEEKEGTTVERTKSAAEKRGHRYRSDYYNRKEVAPDGFESALYKFKVPGSIRECTVKMSDRDEHWKVEYVTRKYSASTETTYQRKGIPIKFLRGADGRRVNIDTDESPDESGLYRTQSETRKIPVTVTTYDYLGDTWEVLSVEAETKADDYPRDYALQFQKVVVGLVVSLSLYMALALL